MLPSRAGSTNSWPLQPVVESRQGPATAGRPAGWVSRRQETGNDRFLSRSGEP